MKPKDYNEAMEYATCVNTKSHLKECKECMPKEPTKENWEKDWEDLVINMTKTKPSDMETFKIIKFFIKSQKELSRKRGLEDSEVEHSKELKEVYKQGVKDERERAKKKAKAKRALEILEEKINEE